jgi:hypothetical protein
LLIFWKLYEIDVRSAKQLQQVAGSFQYRIFRDPASSGFVGAGNAGAADKSGRSAEPAAAPG